MPPEQRRVDVDWSRAPLVAIPAKQIGDRDAGVLIVIALQDGEHDPAPPKIDT